MELLLVVGYGVGYFPAVVVLGRLGEPDWHAPYRVAVGAALMWPVVAAFALLLGLVYGVGWLAEQIGRRLP